MQRLRSDDGDRAAALAHQRLRRIEELHAGDKLAALDHEINTAPQHALIKGAGPEHALVKPAANLQDTVPNHLRLQPRGCAAPVQFVLRIRLQLGGIMCGALAVGGTHHDLFVQRLEPPAVFDQLQRQPVEQLRMRGQLALQTEIVGRIHNAAAEMMLPQAVGHHPREQVPRAVFGVRKPIGQRTPAVTSAPTLGRGYLPRLLVLAAAHQHLQEALRGLAVFLVRITAFQEIGLLVKMREPAAIGVVLGGFEAFAGHLHLFHLRHGLTGEVLLHVIVQFGPLGVLRAVNLQ